MLAVATAGVIAIVAIAVVAFAFSGSDVEDLIDAGRLEDARRAIEAIEVQRGKEDAEALYLRGRVAEREESPGEAAALYGRAVAAGSGDALGALARDAASSDCDRRRRAAEALARARAPRALPVLKRIASDDRESQPKGALDQIAGFLGGDMRCGVDTARRAIKDLEGK
jgi:hypothetical protein